MSVSTPQEPVPAQTPGFSESDPSLESTAVAVEDSTEIDGAVEEDPQQGFINLKVHFPDSKEPLEVLIPPSEQVHDVRQSIIDNPDGYQYTCFHLEHNGELITDFIPIAEVPGLLESPEVHLVEDPYTEKDARIHLGRIREIIGIVGDKTNPIQGVSAGTSVFDFIPEEDIGSAAAAAATDGNPTSSISVNEYDFSAKTPLSTIVPNPTRNTPKTAKILALSPWNPPPCNLRQQGHLLYLVLTTLEGEQVQITSHIGGFYVNNSSNAKFDPSPRASPKDCSSHSLLTLLEKVSPAFQKAFSEYLTFLGQRDLLATFQVTHASPAAPWLVHPDSIPSVAHTADPVRPQEAYLVAGADGTDSMRDWNEEFQSARELSKASIQERVFRERLVTKMFADYVDAATKGAILVARGEIAPLNPTESPDAQIFVYNNIFFSFGADGVSTFASEGGDEAARVATSKDVSGVQLVNQVDVDGLFTAATVLVDYLGKRIIGQSIVPGIFRQREPDEPQIDYGGVEGKDSVATDERFVEKFAQLSKALKVKKHAVWDKEGKRHDLEASVETKGLMGTDGRRYILDLYRLTPLDIAWIEECAKEEESGEEKLPAYPHRMTVLRTELVDLFARTKMKQWLDKKVAEHTKNKKQLKQKSEVSQEESESTDKKPEDDDYEKVDKSEANEAATTEAQTEAVSETKEEKAVEGEAEDDDDDEESALAGINVEDFQFALNPDVFSGQVPQSDEEKAEWACDEALARDVCQYLKDEVIPNFLQDLSESDIGFPVDGVSLSQALHKRGINVRYLGRITTKALENPNLACLVRICHQDMLVRSFKHVANRYLRKLPFVMVTSCLSHLLNCFLGFNVNDRPVAQVSSSLKKLYPQADVSFESVTVQSLREDLVEQARLRFRYQLPETVWTQEFRPFQFLRDACLRLGLQLKAREYQFGVESDKEIVSGLNLRAANTISFSKADSLFGDAPSPVSSSSGNKNAKGKNGHGNKKNRKTNGHGQNGASSANGGTASVSSHTFTADDIVNIIPVVKHSCPRSALAEEAFEAGRVSIMQKQRKVGQELLFESLSLHEQIYNILHPEVARAYNSLSTLYYQMDEKDIAVELARKAVIVSERTLGVDSSETLLNYLNLSLFLYQNGDTLGALKYTKHAFKLWRLVYGPNHPDSITAINNAAVMLQNIKAYHESRRWFEESLRICEETFGKNSINTATLLFQLAQALVLDRDPKGAVQRMKESYNIFLTELGPEDKNTKEAENWLERLTQNAVNIARQTKELETRRTIRSGFRVQPQRGPFQSVAHNAGSRMDADSLAAAAAAAASSPSSSAVGGASATAAAMPKVDKRNIDELIKFIEGNEENKKTNPSAQSKRNPKRRTAV